MKKEYLQAPFPYFGGKRKIAHIVWSALGDVKHYIEPFFGSGAVLLARPNWNPKKHVETVNDKDAFLCNVWRSLQFSPDETARWCDWPVNHVDLIARRKMLVEKENYLIEGLLSDPEWHDPKLAGYWIWAASCWIGSGLTTISSIGQIPHLANTGKGVHKLGPIPHLPNTGKGVQEPYNTNIYQWFRALSERLRYVRVVCGDWTRVCGGDWQDDFGNVGIFFDPPYGAEDRGSDLYHHDSQTIAKDVMEWALERGKRNTYRIVIAGYEEYKELLNHGWKIYEWVNRGGYGNQGKTSNENRFRETLYISPHCVGQKCLF